MNNLTTDQLITGIFIIVILLFSIGYSVYRNLNDKRKMKIARQTAKEAEALLEAQLVGAYAENALRSNQISDLKDTPTHKSIRKGKSTNAKNRQKRKNRKK